MNGRRWGGDGLDELLRAGDRARYVHVTAGRTARALARVRAHHAAVPLVRPRSPSPAEPRNGGFEIRRARLKLYRRMVPVLTILALLMTGDTPGNALLPLPSPAGIDPV